VDLPATAAPRSNRRQTIPRLATSASFDALTAKTAAPQEKHVPTVAPDLPAGLKTRPWRHQIAAYDSPWSGFSKDSTA
jgi:hypothetical protein